MSTGARNLAWADALIAALAASGLRHVVLSPGARSAPLAVACLRRPEIICHVINDERAAGFFAVGLGKASGQPALVLTTSGTAAANLLPAIVEANLSHTPLIAVTADRPPEMLGWGANQTIDQVKLFGDQVRAFHTLPPPDEAFPPRFLTTLAARLVETALFPHAGPVHLNVPFREPLLPEVLPAPPALPPALELHPQQPALPSDLDTVAARLQARPGVILCGEARYPAGFAAAVTRLAARLEAPIIAEALSNLRFGAHDKSRISADAARFLRHTAPPAPAWVLRFGAFPVSRTLERWLADLAETEHLLVAPPGSWPDPLHHSDTLLRGDPLDIAAALAERCRPASAEFSERHGGRRDIVISAGAEFRLAWQRAEAGVTAAEDLPFFEGTVAHRLLAALPAGAHCFIGNSLAIRAVDAYSGKSDKPLTLYGNRGASGIDGNLATAAGIAAASGAPIALLVGDLSLLHDCASLALLRERNALIVVLDNGGGGIFDHLPFARMLPPALLERGFIAKPHADFAALARAFDLAYAEAADLQALDAVLAKALQHGGTWLLRVVIDRGASRAGFTGA